MIVEFVDGRRRIRRILATEVENWSRWIFMENFKGVRVFGWKYLVLELVIFY